MFRNCLYKFHSFLPLCVFVCVACNNGKKETNPVVAKDSVNQAAVVNQSAETVYEENTLDTAVVNNLKQIVGTWAALEGDQDLTISISKDSIFYAEHAESHKYELMKDSIYIHYPDYILAGKALLLKDTFAIVSEEQASKFLRKGN